MCRIAISKKETINLKESKELLERGKENEKEV